jgi:hypothetical protein
MWTLYLLTRRPSDAPVFEPRVFLSNDSFDSYLRQVEYLYDESIKITFTSSVSRRKRKVNIYSKEITLLVHSSSMIEFDDDDTNSSDMELERFVAVKTLTQPINL